MGPKVVAVLVLIKQSTVVAVGLVEPLLLVMVQMLVVLSTVVAAVEWEEGMVVGELMAVLGANIAQVVEVLVDKEGKISLG